MFFLKTTIPIILKFLSILEMIFSYLYILWLNNLFSIKKNQRGYVNFSRYICSLMFNGYKEIRLLLLYLYI